MSDEVVGVVVDETAVPSTAGDETVAAPVEEVTPVEDKTAEVTPVEEDKPKEEVKTKEGETEFTPVEEGLKVSEGMTYNGVEVEVDIPADLINMAGEKGIDIQEVSKELYTSEDFTLSEETMNGLYEAFGKWQVDSYLEGIKAKNDAVMGEFNTKAEQTKQEAEAAWKETVEIIGGEENWEHMDAYAAENLSDEELEEFNNVMENGSIRMQKLMIKDLYSRYESGAPPTEGHKILDLEEGASGPANVSDMNPLSQADYLQLLTTGKYKDDPAKYDNLRRLGIQKGI